MSTDLERVTELAAEELGAEHAAKGRAPRIPEAGREAQLERENRRLREANEELRRANRALARDAMARYDSGAAGAIQRATVAERALLRTQGWNEWPLPLRFAVGIGLRLRKLRNRLRG